MYLKFYSGNFYAFLALIALSSSFGMFIAFNYKEYGMLHIQDDQFLTLAGSLGGIANGFSRIFWGTLLDFFTFKTLMIVVNGGLLAIALSIQFLSEQKVFFVIYVVITYFLYGGLFSLMPAKTYQIYGQKNGARVYSYAFFGFSIGSTLQFLLHYFLVGSEK
jgi:predicted MFS family arabinose efflux permease